MTFHAPPLPAHARRRTVTLCLGILVGLAACIPVLSGPADAVPQGSVPPVAGLSTTGDASQTMVHPAYSTIGETAQQRVSWIYDLAEDGARGDAASDTAALKRAIGYAGIHAGTVIQFPAGTWALTSPGATGFVLPSNTILEGASQAGTVLTWNDDQSNSDASTFNLFAGYNQSPAVNVVFRNFTIRGKEDLVPAGGSTEIGTAGYGGYPFLVTGVTGLTFDHVTVAHSRIMSIVARLDTNVTVSDCIVQYSSRDGISIGQSTDISITDNVVEHAGDDAIAVHSATGEPWGARRDIIITGNRIFDAQGINASSARSANISGNILDNIRTAGIKIGTASAGAGGQEGFAASTDVLISNNVITNLVNRQHIDNLNGGQSYIVVIGNSARAGGYSAVPGTPGADGIVHPPYYEFLANSTDSGTPTNPSSGILITGNIMGRMIPPTDGSDSRFKTWTDLGFGPLWVQDKGNISPSLALGDMTGSGVQLYGGVTQNVQITDNQFSGMFNALYLDNATDLGTVTFRGNAVTDMASSGIFLATSAKGTLFLDDNVFDLDPYFISSSRGSNGTWKNPYGPLAINNYSSPNLSLVARRNTVRNAGGDSNTSTASPPANWMLSDNVLQADPTAVGGYDARNKGVGTVRVTGGFRLLQTDSDPTSATYGQMLTNSAMEVWNGMPSNGKWMTGQAVWNASAGASQPYGAFLRATTGTGSALYADWLPVPVLVGGNLQLDSNKAVTFGDATTGKVSFLNMDTTGWLNLSVTGTGDGLADLRMDQLQLNQKLYLDPARTMWVQEINNKVVVGSGGTNLFSIDRNGNVLAKGSITGNASP